MARQVIGASRLAQRTSAAKNNANFIELYDRSAEPVTIVAATAAGTFVVPAGYAIQYVYINNTTANAITGGLKFGTAAGGTQVVAAQAVGANALLVILSADIVSRIFSRTVPQTVYFDAVTAWNAASVDIKILLRKVW